MNKQNKISIAVIYHSGYGHTKKQAEAVALGAQATLIAINAEGDIGEADWKMLDDADAIIFGSPTYMGGVSWQFKKFADATSKQWFAQKWKNKVFAGFTNSGSINGDKLSTLQYMFALAMQHFGVWVGMDLMPSSTKASVRNDINYLGAFSGAMMQSPSDASADEVFPGDVEVARLFGERVAKITKQFTAGQR